LHDGSGVESPLTVVPNDFGGKLFERLR
jgi:hypothetical protein